MAAKPGGGAVPEERVSQHRIVFAPSGKRGTVAQGTTILAAARALGVDLDSVCGGRGICGRCQVTLSTGSFAKEAIESRADHLSDVNAVETAYATRRGLAPGRRLGCTASILGDCVIDVPPESQMHRQVIRKEADARPIEIDPVIHLHYVEIPLTDIKDGPAALIRALRAQWPLGDVRLAESLQASVVPLLETAQGKVTIALRLSEEIVALWPGYREAAYGLAIDVGSTTLAAYLCDLADGRVIATAGQMNPQIRFGEDLMSRISYAMLNPEGGQHLTAAIREALTGLVDRLCQDAAMAPADIVEAVIVGNPVMHHLLLGLDAVPLGQAPFMLAFSHSAERPAREIGLSIATGAKAYFLPLIAGHVGADTVAAILAEAPHKDDAMTLLVDVGTNAELVLGNRHRVLAASSPTGPAFEGAQISCGQRAAPGAIERVRIDRETLEPQFKIIGSDLWSDDPGFSAAAAHTGITGICGSGIIEALAELYLAGVIRPDGTIVGALAARSARIEPDGRTFAYRLCDGPPILRLTQNDVRAIQLAKAALYAGARLLMDHAGIDHVDRIILAGAFGSHIDPKYAMILGLIPDCDLSQVRAAGNAAGIGARIALLNRAERATLDSLALSVEKVETALEPAFQQHFVAAMALPHASDPFPNLSALIPLPRASERQKNRRRR